MTYYDQIVELLTQRSGDSVCDDCLAIALKMKARQQARSRCISLEASGAVIREESVICKICNRAKFGTRIGKRETLGAVVSTVDPGKGAVRRSIDIREAPANPWFWEGHVQRVIVGWLHGNGWNVTQHADTAAKTPGKDIIASKHDEVIWVTVKGFPKGTERTSRATQAAHWFARAMFDLVKYRTESSSAKLAMGLPDCSVTYRRLVEKSVWAFRSLPAQVIWVNDFGKIEVQNC